MATPQSGLSDASMALLEAVLDAIIPRSESRGMPGAGEVGLAPLLCENALGFVEAVTPGLDALREEMESRQVADLAAQPDSEKRSLLEAAAAKDPAFLPGLLFQVYSNYYQQPRVLVALGMEGRPPYPEGYALEAGDQSLLDPVRRRAPLYREVP